MSEDALDYASLSYNQELSNLRVENTKQAADLERETLFKDQLQIDVSAVTREHLPLTVTIYR